MLTDEQLIERLRSSLEVEAAKLELPPDLLPSPRQLHPRCRDRVPRPSLGGILTALATGSAVGIAILAFVFVRHHESNPRGTVAVPAAARPLASKLAILRRPQTPADRSLPAWAVRAATYNNPQQAPLGGLTRLAATLPPPPIRGATEPKGTRMPRIGRVRIYLVVQPPAPDTVTGPVKVPGGRGPLSAAHVTALVLSNSSESGTSAVTASQLYESNNMIPGTGPSFFGGPGYNVGIVPDGVARVRWTFSGLYGFVKAHRPRFAVYPTIENNVAISPITKNQGFVTGVTWYARDGRVIKALNPPIRPINPFAGPRWQDLGRHRQVSATCNGAPVPHCVLLMSDGTKFRCDNDQIETGFYNSHTYVGRATCVLVTAKRR